MTDKPAPSHAKGVPECYASTVDVELFGIDSQAVAAVKRLAGERLIEFPKPDIIDAQAMAFQQFRDGEYRADPHLLRRATCDLEAAIEAQYRVAAPLRLSALHQDLG